VKVPADIQSVPSKAVLVDVVLMLRCTDSHENLLRSNSSFFDKALKKEWKEGQDRVVDMPDADNEAFGIWVKWLYTALVFIHKEGDEIIKDGVQTNSREWLRWSKCYALGDFLQDTDFMNALIDVVTEIIEEANAQPVSLPNYIYSHSTENSAHRKLVVDILLRCWDRTAYAKTVVDQPQEFLYDILVNMAPHLGTSIQQASDVKALLNTADLCEYHDHGPDQPCYRIKPGFKF